MLIRQNYANLNWTTNGSGTFINQGQINPTYIPSDADIAMGSVTLTLEAANPPCLSDFDQMMLTLEALPIVNAGNDATIDIGSSYTITNASVQNAANFAWSSSGTGALTTSTALALPTHQRSGLCSG